MTKARDLSAVPNQSLGFKNRIINGNFDVWQRGTSFTVNNSSNTYTADRWACFANGGVNVNVTRQSNSFTGNGTSNSIRVQRDSGASGRMYLYQMLETSNLNSFRGQTVTLSFRARRGSDFGSNNLVARIATKSAETTWDDGVVESAEITPSLGTDWAQYSVSLTLTSASNAANGFTVAFIAERAGGANVWYEITQVQLEIGSVTTNFDTRSYGTELALCKRYCEVWRFDGSGTSNDRYHSGAGWTDQAVFKVEVEKRSAPSVTITGSTELRDGANAARPITSAGANRFAIILGIAGGTTLTYSVATVRFPTGNTDAVIISAEL